MMPPYISMEIKDVIEISNKKFLKFLGSSLGCTISKSAKLMGVRVLSDKLENLPGVAVVTTITIQNTATPYAKLIFLKYPGEAKDLKLLWITSCNHIQLLT